jgi:hypothetical protein
MCPLQRQSVPDIHLVAGQVVQVESIVQLSQEYRHVKQARLLPSSYMCVMQGHVVPSSHLVASQVEHVAKAVQFSHW